MKPLLRHKLLLLAISVVVTLGVAELACRAIGGSPRSAKWSVGARLQTPEPKPDARLGRRMPPNAPGHDAKGFRNALVPEKADIVAIGDSHTWGVNAEIDEAWPQSVGRLTGRTVYNLAFGGYGPIQYEALVDEAEPMRPGVIVVGLYLGNDFWDAYNQVYCQDGYAQLRLPSGAEALGKDTIRPRYDAILRRRHSFHRPTGGGAWLQRNLALARLLTQAGFMTDHTFEVQVAGDEAWLRAWPEDGLVFECGPASTALMTSCRLMATDLDEPRIAEGLRLTCDALARMRARCDTAGTRMLAVLIPTKEVVYSVAVEPARRDATYDRLVEMEARAARALVEACQRSNIALLDLLPFLRAALAKRTALYPRNADGHPLPAGYAVYASSIADEIRRMGW